MVTLASDRLIRIILTSDWLIGVTEPLRPDVPIFGTECSPLPPAPAPPLQPEADLKDTPHQVSVSQGYFDNSEINQSFNLFITFQNSEIKLVFAGY